MPILFSMGHWCIFGAWCIPIPRFRWCGLWCGCCGGPWLWLLLLLLLFCCDVWRCEFFLFFMRRFWNQIFTYIVILFELENENFCDFWVKFFCWVLVIYGNRKLLILKKLFFDVFFCNFWLQIIKKFDFYHRRWPEKSLHSEIKYFKKSR